MPRRIDLDQYRKRAAREDDVAEVLHESFVLTDERGRPVMAYIADGWTPEEDRLLDDIFAVLGRIRYEHGARPEGLVSTSRTFGWKPRLEFRQDFCSASSLSREQPDEHATVVAGAALVGEHYRRINPYLYRKHAVAAQMRVRDEYHLEDEVFTSGIINENNPLKYHFDAGNFKGVWSGMLAFREHTQQGYLALPAYDLAVGIAHKSLFLFDGQGILHGVTPIKLLRPDAKRYSIVYYSLERMWQCEPVGDEVARSKRVRTIREDERARTMAGRGPR